MNQRFSPTRTTSFGFFSDKYNVSYVKDKTPKRNAGATIDVGGRGPPPSAEAGAPDAAGVSARGGKSAHGGPRTVRARTAGAAGAGAGIRVAHPLREGVAGEGGRVGAHQHARRGTSWRPQHLERAQPARTVLGGADAAAARDAREHGRPAVVVPAVHAAAGHDRARLAGLVRRGRARRPRARPAGHALRPLHQRRALVLPLAVRDGDRGRGPARPVRLPLPLQPHARRPPLRPRRVRRPRRPQPLPGHGPRRPRPLLHEPLPGRQGGLHRVPRRAGPAHGAQHLPRRRPLSLGLRRRQREGDGQVLPPPQSRGLPPRGRRPPSPRGLETGADGAVRRQPRAVHSPRRVREEVG